MLSNIQYIVQKINQLFHSFWVKIHPGAITCNKIHTHNVSGTYAEMQGCWQYNSNRPLHVLSPSTPIYCPDSKILSICSIILPSRHFPLNKTLCSNRNLSMASLDEKLISRETALHFKIFFGTLAVKRKFTCKTI